MDRLTRIYELTIKKKEIEEELKRLNTEILFSYDFSKENLENEKIKLTYVPATSYQSIDLKAVEKNEPDLYKDLKDVYSKTIKRSAYLRTKIK